MLLDVTLQRWDVRIQISIVGGTQPRCVGDAVDVTTVGAEIAANQIEGHKASDEEEEQEGQTYQHHHSLAAGVPPPKGDVWYKDDS